MDIDARLERLEKENRRMKKIGIVVVVFASVLFISGQAKTNKVVEANEFVLKGGNGKARCETFDVQAVGERGDAEGHPESGHSMMLKVIPESLSLLSKTNHAFI